MYFSLCGSKLNSFKDYTIETESKWTANLSSTIDFGKEWLGLNCSDTYYKTVFPIFTELNQLKEQNELWCNLKDKHKRFYIPILEAFQI